MFTGKGYVIIIFCFIPWLCFKAVGAEAGCKYLIEINETQYFMTSRNVLLGWFIYFEDLAGQIKADSRYCPCVVLQKEFMSLSTHVLAELEEEHGEKKTRELC